MTLKAKTYLVTEEEAMELATKRVRELATALKDVSVDSITVWCLITIALDFAVSLGISKAQVMGACAEAMGHAELLQGFGKDTGSVN